MSEVAKFMRARRSVLVRDMVGEPLAPEIIRDIVQIGTRVPDHGKLAPWRIILLDDTARTELSDLAYNVSVAKGNEAQLAEEDRKRFLRAPTILTIISAPKSHPKIPVWEQHLSAGAVCYGVLIAAQSMGYAAQWLTGWVAYDAQIKTVLGVESGEEVAGFIHIGHVDTPPQDRPRPALEDVFFVGLDGSESA